MNEKEKIENPRLHNPDGMYASEARNEPCVTLRDYAQIKFMSAIISNADTMRELTREYKNQSSKNKVEFEDMISKLGGFYADSMLRHRK